MLATTETVAEKTSQDGMRVLVPRLSFEETVNKYQECLLILVYLGNTDSAAEIYKGRTEKKDGYERETERNGKHLRPA